MAKSYKPWPYQERACQWILDHPCAGLFLEMGLGKTVTTLTAINELIYNRFEVEHVLVIAPLRVAMTVWEEEAKKWDHLQGLTFSKVLGTASERKQALRKPADVYIINRENVPWLCDLLITEKVSWPFDMVVIDELSSFKSSKAARFRSLRRVRPKIRRMIGLTGTPAPNGLMDLFAEVYMLDCGERLGRTLGGYRDRYFTPGKHNGYIVYEWKPKPGAEEAIYKKLGDMCISMTAEDYLSLPERRDIIETVEMSEAGKKAYAKMEHDMLIKIADSEITASSAAVVTNKLLQMASGAVYDSDGKGYAIHEDKLDKLEDLIESANGQPVMVYYGFKHERDRILQRIDGCRCLETAEDVSAWNRGEIKVLLAHPASAGHGLNLQAGGHILIWFGLTWSLELYQQANARLYRQGQDHGVTIYHLVTKGTVDETVLQMLNKKDQRQTALIDAVKARIEEVVR